MTKTKTGRNGWSSVTPVLRRAALLQISPPPTAEMADSLVDYLTTEWPRVSSQYQRTVSEAAGVDFAGLGFDQREAIRPRLEGQTRVLDFPRLRSDARAWEAFDTRISMAICIEADMSSKVWSRVGLPLESSGTRPAVDVEKLSELTGYFRQIAKLTAQWALSLLRRAVRDLFPDLRTRSKGYLEVSALGARDQRLVPFFEKLSRSETTAEELLKDPQAEECFARYFRPATTLSIKRLRDAASHDSASFWFSSPVAVELKDGELGVRDVLYLLRPTDDAVEALGLGYDDSVAGDLAQRSAVKVSRWMANRV